MMFERGLDEKLALPEKRLNFERCSTSAFAPGWGIVSRLNITQGLSLASFLKSGL
jgi:hypothetical protein